MNGQGPQGMHMGWQNPYAFQGFPPPGFMPGLAAYFRNFMPGFQAIPTPISGMVQANRENIETGPNSENEPMTVDKNNTNQNIATGMTCTNPGVAAALRAEPRENAIAGPSRPHCPESAHTCMQEPEQCRRNFGMDSTSEEDEPQQECDTGKGKRRATHQKMRDDECQKMRER